MADTLTDAHHHAQAARGVGHDSIDPDVLVMILRFVVDLAVPWTNNQAERDVRPVKIQQRTSGGCWRTLTGPADFAIVQSYLSTATKWGRDSYDVLTELFTTGTWLPPAAAPCWTATFREVGGMPHPRHLGGSPARDEHFC